MIHLYFRIEPAKHKFIWGDRYIISFIKKHFYRKKVSGVEKVFINLCKSLDLLGVKYDVNLPFRKLRAGEPVVVLGVNKYAFKGFPLKSPVIAGIGLMTHPSYWPSLCEEYPVAKYLQHSEWAKNVYVPYYGADKCDLWFAGIDTDQWSPNGHGEKKYDFLIYNKIMWDKEKNETTLRLPILEKLDQLGISYINITYGQYMESEYLNSLRQCRAMVFLCEHESQGFACCEALSMNVPVFAWDQGLWLDPNRFEWGESKPVPATSVPFFDDKCGMKFASFNDFENKISVFWDKVTQNEFSPRNYILHNLTLKKSAERLLAIINEVYPG